MKILHISDTHGGFPKLRPEGDIVVHSGDFCPNQLRCIAAIEAPYQTKWLWDKADEITKWLGGRQLLVTKGNHDFVNVGGVLAMAGVDAVSLDQTLVEVGDTVFLGFSYTSWFTGEWDQEVREEEMDQNLMRFADPYLDAGVVDVFVPHSPVHGVLDMTPRGERAGSHAIRQRFEAPRYPVKAILHGHIHEARGIHRWKHGITISNAATTQNLVDV